MAESKLFSQSYTRFCVDDARRGLVDFTPVKGSFVTLDTSNNPEFDNYDNSADYWCEYLDGDLKEHLVTLGRHTKPTFYSLWSRRYAWLRVTFEEDFLEDEEVECIIVHENGTMQYYPSGNEVLPQHVASYSAEDYGDSCLGYFGEYDRYMVYENRVYSYNAEKEVEL